MTMTKVLSAVILTAVVLLGGPVTPVAPQASADFELECPEELNGCPWSGSQICFDPNTGGTCNRCFYGGTKPDGTVCLAVTESGSCGC